MATKKISKKSVENAGNASANVVEMEIKTPVKVQPVIKNDIDKLFFADVKKVEAKKVLPDYHFNSYNDTMIIVNHNGVDTIVNNCSSNYLLLPNQDIFPTLERELAKFGDVQIKREIRQDSSFFVTYDFLSKDKIIEIAGTDKIFPRISIQNSYNSRNLFSVDSGFFRCVCQNGLCLPVEDSTFNTILSHCNGNLEKIINSTLEGISQFLSQSKDIAGEYEILMENKVSMNELENTVEKILKGAKALISYKDMIVDRIKKENAESAIELNLFSIYNGINYALQPNNNPKITANPEDRMKTDEKILDYIFNMAV